MLDAKMLLVKIELLETELATGISGTSSASGEQLNGPDVSIVQGTVVHRFSQAEMLAKQKELEILKAQWRSLLTPKKKRKR